MHVSYNWMSSIHQTCPRALYAYIYIYNWTYHGGYGFGVCSLGWWTTHMGRRLMRSQQDFFWGLDVTRKNYGYLEMGPKSRILFPIKKWRSFHTHWEQLFWPENLVFPNHEERASCTCSMEWVSTVNDISSKHQEPWIYILQNNEKWWEMDQFGSGASHPN